MVNGIKIIREHFSDFKDQYTVIGGFACDLLMNDAGLDFKQTVDIDMVLTVEALTRPQSNVVLQPDTHLMPLHIDDEVSSLSART